MWAHDLLDNYSKDPRIKAIVDNVRTILVPVVNADGFNYSRESPADDGNKVSNPVLGGDGGSAVVAGGQGQYVRKNRRALVSTHLGDGTTDTQQEKPKGYDAFLTGIDPNRNYAYAWGDDQAGSSANMLDQTYRGTDPFSEAESKNVSYLLRTHHPVAMITHHTSGDLVLWAWGDTQADAYDNDLLEGFGRAMAVYNGYEAKKSIGLYVTTGTTSDYAYGVFGSIGYTFEHAGDSFHPPYPATVPAMYARNREAFILLNMEICLTPGQRVDNPQPANVQAKLDAKGYEGGLNHAIITGRTVNAAGQGVPGVVKLFKAFDTLLWKNGNGNNPLGQAAYREYIETSMETGPDGRFEYHVNPSTRPFLLIEDEREAYQLAVQGKASGQGISRSVDIDRGEILNLGNIVVA
jgi:hypothetical protein